ncbi:dethiobiotin synthase [Lutimonas sp.]|uniref:dethiobiotin synthase n=1 Tax=Lutimonas sp. TaxID=1872403 RepID=UPI003D9B9EF3
MNKFFITGIGTDVGKTVVSAIVVEALKADYWKPIQAGELTHSDIHSVEELISNSRSRMHTHRYALKTPMSPHAAADIDGVQIELSAMKEPETKNNLVIEGAGGLLVPINEQDTILDMIQDDYKVIVVSRHYLGSINHTLLTLSQLRSKGVEVSGIVFNGEEHPSTEAIILKMGQVQEIGRIDQELVLDKKVISKYAQLFKSRLEAL